MGLFGKPLRGKGHMKGDQPEEKGGHHHIYQKPKRGHLTESGNRRLHREKLRGTGILGFFKKDDD